MTARDGPTRITRLQLNRFRGVRSADLDGLVDVNIIVGRNNCGKSTVLESIGRAAQGLDPIARRSGERMISHRGGRWDQSSREDVFAGERYADIALWVRTPNGLGVWGFRIDAKEETETRSDSDPVESERQQTRVRPSADVLDHLKAFLGKAVVFLPDDGRNTSIEDRLWPQLIGERADKLLVEIHNEVFSSSVEGFQVLGSEKRMVTMFANYSLSLDVQGDGVRSVLRTMMMMTASHNTAFLLEEPEVHQHPGSLRRFAQAAVKLASRNGLQLFLTTHSSDCVRSFLDAAGEEAGEEAVEAAVFHLKNDDGNVDVRRLEPDTVSALNETELDVRYLDLYV